MASVDDRNQFGPDIIGMPDPSAEEPVPKDPTAEDQKLAQRTLAKLRLQGEQDNTIAHLRETLGVSDFEEDIPVENLSAAERQRRMDTYPDLLKTFRNRKSPEQKEDAPSDVSELDKVV